MSLTLILGIPIPGTGPGIAVGVGAAVCGGDTGACPGCLHIIQLRIVLQTVADEVFTLGEGL